MKINWLSAVDPNNQQELLRLQQRMAEFYTSNGNYFKDISFNENIWSDRTQLVQADLVNELMGKRAILEVGCGTASILKAQPALAPFYTGLDFSPTLMAENKIQQPAATFVAFEQPTRFPLPSQGFDAVFSHFVIEHVVFPHLFLDECLRVLRPGGTLMIVCPDFLGTNHMTSQRTGWGPGTGREKLSKGKILDALVTGWDARIRVPSRCRVLRRQISSSYRFMVNVDPTCFADPFMPDVDAVYVTYEKEIKNYTKPTIRWAELRTSLLNFAHQKRLLFLKGVKVS